MQIFNHVRVEDSAGAIAIVSQDPQAEYLAGGTTLVDLMSLNVMSPRVLVDINRVPLTKIEINDHNVMIGAMVRNSDLAYHDKIRAMYPALSEALLSGASAQLRNMATVGGNLMQKTRCYYYRDGHSACNKRQPGSGCAALDGFNRIHAVLGTSDQCIATHPSDMCVPLAAMDAIIHVQGPAGERTIPFSQFYVAYGDDPARETVLQHGELITAVELPVDPWLARSHYLKVRDRESYEFALASAAVILDTDGGVIRRARVALGGIASKPWRSTEAENALVGAKADDAAFTKAADAALQNAKPRKDNAFKVELAKRTLIRALQTVVAMA